ncbi:MAG: hypothetical protein ACK5T6_10200 [Pirellula sp.]
MRGIKPFALERLEWSGKMPFEIQCVTIEPDGFKIAFTKPVEATTAKDSSSYQVAGFTYPYHAGYGGPEIEQYQPAVTSVELADDGMSAIITVDKLKPGFVYELDLIKIRSRDNEQLLHRNAFYTVNEVPNR